MATNKMHADEVETDVELVERLLTAQFPQWAGLALRSVPSGGTDNAIYRLGEDMAVRLPRVVWAVGQVDKEQQWLPQLAPHLPLAIPVPLAKGEPGEGYPWNWSVYRWLAGENATLDRLSDSGQAARDLAGFITALQGIDAAEGPQAGAHNFSRGVPLAMRDEGVREAIRALGERIDTGAATAAWEESLRVSVWDREPVWVHGDLQSGNLLALEGWLHAVIDFGGLGVGDPACDLMVAWNLFSEESREIFRDALGVDAATWIRGRGWALSVGLIALPYYWDTSPSMVQYAQYTIAEVLADFARAGDR